MPVRHHALKHMRASLGTMIPEVVPVRHHALKYMKEIANLAEYSYFYPTIEELNLK